MFLPGFKEMPPVALNESDLSELLAALNLGDPFEAEATAVIGARPHERTDTRLAQRNGHRPKLVSTSTRCGTGVSTTSSPHMCSPMRPI